MLELVLCALGLGRSCRQMERSSVGTLRRPVERVGEARRVEGWAAAVVDDG